MEGILCPDGNALQKNKMPLCQIYRRLRSWREVWPNNCYRKASIYSLSGQERGKREKERERERKREREGRKDRYMYTYREPTVKSFQRRIYSRLSALMCLIGRVPESLHSALHTHAMRFFCERIFRSREGRGKKCRERQRSDGREGAIASALFCPAGLLHLL